jgi:hypothetical protein
MFTRFLIGATAIVLMGCGRQGATPRSAAYAEPVAVQPVGSETTRVASSPGVSAGRGDDSAPPAATLASSPVMEDRPKAAASKLG